MKNANINVRIGNQQDINQLWTLFKLTIANDQTGKYSEEEKAIWINSPQQERWEKAMTEQHFLLAEMEGNNNLIGFISSTPQGYIDFIYVHPNHQRKGVAQLLLDHITEYANTMNISHLSSDVSLIARPFFEKNGFKIVSKNENRRGKVTLINFSVKKGLK